MPELEDFLERVLAEYPVDRERVYLTGASMGGFGSWRLAAEHPDLFAAVVPLCGGGDPRDVERIKDVPVWNFHGGKDLVVPIRLSNEMVEALRKIHGRVRFTVYANCDHNNCADQTYNTDALYSWMLAQSRGKPAEPPTTLTGVVPSELLP
jgi:predicted peptidase